MSAFVHVADTAELPDGALKKVRVEGREIVLARVGDAYYAADARCPHMGGDLSEGTLEGTVVTCPRHGSRFDLSDGAVMLWTAWTGVLLSAAKFLRSPRPLTTYAVKVEGERVLVDLQP